MSVQRYQQYLNSTLPAMKNQDTDESTHAVLYASGITLKVSSIYLLAATIGFRVKSKTRERQMRNKSRTIGIFKSKKVSRCWNLDEFCLLTTVFAFCTCMADSPFVSLVETTDVLCKAVQATSSVFYSCATFCLYTFLWLRQRACYRNKSLRSLQNRFTAALSKFVLLVYLVLKITGFILTCTVWNFVTSERGCVESSHSVAPLVVMYVASVVMHVTLLALFLKPLERHLRFSPLKKDARENEATATLSDKRLERLVKRCLISTCLCVIADTTSFIAVISLPTSLVSRAIVINYIYDFSLLLATVFINGSFADWKKRLLPCRRTIEVRDEEQANEDYISTLTRSSASRHKVVEDEHSPRQEETSLTTVNT